MIEIEVVRAAIVGYLASQLGPVTTGLITNATWDGIKKGVSILLEKKQQDTDSAKDIESLQLSLQDSPKKEHAGVIQAWLKQNPKLSNQLNDLIDSDQDIPPDYDARLARKIAQELTLPSSSSMPYLLKNLAGSDWCEGDTPQEIAQSLTKNKHGDKSKLSDILVDFEMAVESTVSQLSDEKKALDDTLKTRIRKALPALLQLFVNQEKLHKNILDTTRVGIESPSHNSPTFTAVNDYWCETYSPISLDANQIKAEGEVSLVTPPHAEGVANSVDNAYKSLLRQFYCAISQEPVKQQLVTDSDEAIQSINELLQRQAKRKYAHYIKVDKQQFEHPAWLGALRRLEFALPIAIFVVESNTDMSRTTNLLLITGSLCQASVKNILSLTE